MSPTQKPAGSDEGAPASIEEHLASTPDEAGPHDVPDEQVIEKTLPSVPVPGPGGNGPR